MKKTRNLLFTLLVMGLIATPVLKVNAETEDLISAPAEQEEIQPVVQSETPQPIAEEPELDAEEEQLGEEEEEEQLGEEDTVVASIAVKSSNRTQKLYVYEDTTSLYFSSVSYEDAQVTATAYDASGAVIDEADIKLTAGKTNRVAFKGYTLEIYRASYASSMGAKVDSALNSEEYYAYGNDANNSVIISKYTTLDDKDKTSVSYNYEYSLETYDTVEKILGAFEESLKDLVPETVIHKETLSKEVIKKIKDETKVVKASNGIIEWTIDATKLTGKESGIDFRIDFDDDIRLQTRAKIEKLLDDKDSRRIMDFYHTGKLPKGTKVKVYAGYKFNPEDTLTLYYYNAKTNKLEVIHKNLVVDENGFVEFVLEHCSSYVLLPSKNNAKNVQLLATRYNPQTGTMNVTLYAGIALASLAGIVVLRKQMN